MPCHQLVDHQCRGLGSKHNRWTNHHRHCRSCPVRHCCLCKWSNLPTWNKAIFSEQRQRLLVTCRLRVGAMEFRVNWLLAHLLLISSSGHHGHIPCHLEISSNCQQLGWRQCPQGHNQCWQQAHANQIYMQDIWQPQPCQVYTLSSLQPHCPQACILVTWHNVCHQLQTQLYKRRHHQARIQKCLPSLQACSCQILGHYRWMHGLQLILG